MDTVEAVSVSIGYGDFLAVTLPRNLPLFDALVVVTAPNDTATREVCRRYGVKVVLTNEVYRNGAKFNKARAINKGLDQLSHKNWVCHLDADMILPPSFRRVLREADPDPEGLYGCDRVMVKSWADWVRLRDSGYLQHDYHSRVNFPRGYEVGARWANEVHGYCPIGAFQLWHSDADIYKGVHLRHYPVTSNDAARADIQFAILWDRRHRHLLPEVIAIHLESVNAKLGANWNGRTTPAFGPATKK